MAHYFDPNPDGPSERKTVSARFHGIDFVYTTDSDVFSRQHVDFGTNLLVRTVIEDFVKDGIPGDGSLLDLGCGYGVIGIAMKRVFPALHVTMADINARAVELATENAKTNHTPYVRILTSDGWNGIEGSFSTVITNPPVRAGKKTIFSFYDGAYNRITPGGKLYVVLQKKQGAPSSETYLRELFGNCEMIARDAGYWILRSVRTPESDS